MIVKWFLAVLILLTPSAGLARNCAERSHVVNRLIETYGEDLAFGGLQKSRDGLSLMEIWASSETGSFTVLVTNPNGISCIVAVGTDFFVVTPSEEPAGDPL